MLTKIVLGGGGESTVDAGVFKDGVWSEERGKEARRDTAGLRRLAASCLPVPRRCPVGQAGERP